jgi:hypothetical protein
MITHDARRSLSRGKNPVPSPWQATPGHVPIPRRTRSAPQLPGHMHHPAARTDCHSCTLTSEQSVVSPANVPAAAPKVIKTAGSGRPAATRQACRRDSPVTSGRSPQQPPPRPRDARNAADERVLCVQWGTHKHTDSSSVVAADDVMVRIIRACISVGRLLTL